MYRITNFDSSFFVVDTRIWNKRRAGYISNTDGSKKKFRFFDLVPQPSDDVQIARASALSNASVRLIDTTELYAFFFVCLRVDRRRIRLAIPPGPYPPAALFAINDRSLDRTSRRDDAATNGTERRTISHVLSRARCDIMPNTRGRVQRRQRKRPTTTLAVVLALIAALTRTTLAQKSLQTTATTPPPPLPPPPLPPTTTTTKSGSTAAAASSSSKYAVHF